MLIHQHLDALTRETFRVGEHMEHRMCFHRLKSLKQSNKLYIYVVKLLELYARFISMSFLHWSISQVRFPSLEDATKEGMAS